LKKGTEIYFRKPKLALTFPVECQTEIAFMNIGEDLVPSLRMEKNLAEQTFLDALF